MTIKDLYEMAKEKGIENFTIAVRYEENETVCFENLEYDYNDPEEKRVFLYTP